MQSEPRPRPNILFILTDQWRGDCLGYTGHPVVETPHLDLLAERGTVFTRAYSPCPVCVPGRAAIMTGLSPYRHGFLTNGRAFWQYPVTLAGTLAGAGYHTQCVGKMHVDPWRNLVGFHNVVLHDGYMHGARRGEREFGMTDDYTPWLREQLGRPYADHIDTGVGCNGRVARPWNYDEMLHPTSWVTTQGIDFLRRRDPSKPFFLMLSYHRPHPPLDPPEAMLNRYLAKELPPLPMGDWTDSLPPQGSGGHDSPTPRDPAQRDYARRAYYAQITHIDFQINRIRMALYEHGVLDDTAIVFTSDHGEMLYDHGRFGKGPPFESSARVPFILRLPNDEGGRRIVDQPVDLADILPTFCDVAGVDIPPHLDGRSIVPFCRGESPQWRPWLHGENGGSGFQWLTDGHEKYIWIVASGRELLFDLDNDPDETRDLSDARPNRVARWRRELIERIKDRDEGFVRDGELVAGRPTLRILPHAGRGLYPDTEESK